MTDPVLETLKNQSITLPLADRRRITFTGPDAARYLNGQATNNVTNLQPGQACHAAICTHKGRLQGDVWITRIGDEFHVDFEVALEDTLPARLEKYLIADHADCDSEPRPLPAVHVLGSGPPALESLGRENPGQTPSAIPIRRFHTDGFDLYHITASETLLHDDQTQQLRIYLGVPRWGIDYNESHLAPEIFTQPDTIRYDKGCYIGQEVIARIKSVGKVNRKLVLLEGTTPVAPGTPVEQDGREIGTITSCMTQPLEGTPLLRALAIIKTSALEPGTQTQFQVAENSFSPISIQ